MVLLSSPPEVLCLAEEVAADEGKKCAARFCSRSFALDMAGGCSIKSSLQCVQTKNEAHKECRMDGGDDEVGSGQEFWMQGTRASC